MSSNKKITELTALTSVDDADVVPLVDDPSGTPVTKKATVKNLVKGALLDEDNMASDSADQAPTQQSVKAYVDNTVAGENTLAEDDDVNFTGPADADLIQYDNATSKWLDKQVSELSAFKDEDNMASDSATAICSQQSIKAYVDTHASDTTTHGSSTALVGVDETQTLTNKTINTASNTITVASTDVSDFAEAVDDQVNTLATAGEGIDITYDDGAGTLTFAGEDASDTNKGIVELATIDETNTGTDTGRAVTPDGLDGWTGSAQITTVGTLSSGDVTAQVSAASDSAAGKVELATTAETTTGTSTSLAVTPDGLSGSVYGRKTVIVKCIAEGTALTVADGKAYFTVPVDLNGMNLVDADAAVYTVSSSGTPTFQIHNLTDTQDMSTAITIDASEYNSFTAATQPVINTSYDDVATGDILRFDCDVAGTDTTGMDIIMVFQTP